MFQSFNVTSDPANGAPRVARLRAELSRLGLDGFLVPRADQHQGEYVPPSADRLKWLTGFTGSAGSALVIGTRAIVFVDGRYRLQVRSQVDTAVFEIGDLIETPPSAWLKENGSAGWRIGFDPWLHTVDQVAALRKGAPAIDFEPVTANPLDTVWDDRPAPPASPVEIHSLALAGRLAKDKLADLANAVREAGCDHTVLTDPSSLAWAFNIRGRDVPHTPLALGFAILSADARPRLYLDPRKLGIEQRAYLTQLADLREPADLLPDIEALARSKATVGLDFSLAAERLRMAIEEAGGTVVRLEDPAKLPRATKNEAELAGARAAHRRDGGAVTEFLHWLSTVEPGSVDEIAAATRLEALRAEAGLKAQMPLRDISFETISGAGPNGAIIHYRVSTATTRPLGAGELYLVDSGGQYGDGTTDITRTVAIGAPSSEMRRHYTIVLKGMIGISMLRFPQGTRGCDIDAVARLAHWRAGLDFAHGTGHGVGSYLAVHEGPQRIAKTGTQKLLPGMIVSNEPGYYREGAYGIRLENLIVVTEPEPVEGGEIAMHGFETLTLAPFDRRLIAAEMLDAAERSWLDAYHARVLAEIGPLVGAGTRDWLEAACAPL
jgi:Xaa-Pro aminopeptidase